MTRPSRRQVLAAARIAPVDLIPSPDLSPDLQQQMERRINLIAWQMIHEALTTSRDQAPQEQRPMWDDLIAVHQQKRPQEADRHGA